MSQIDYKLPPLHYACGSDELRIIFDHVLITKEEMVASDAHIIAVHKTANYFDSNFIEAMPEQILIHKKNFVHLTKKLENPIILKEDHFRIRHNGFNILIPFANIDINYPNYKACFTITEEQKEDKIPEVGINPNLFYRLGKAMDCDRIALKIHSPTRAIFAYSDDSSNNAYGLIMPFIITEKY